MSEKELTSEELEQVQGGKRKAGADGSGREEQEQRKKGNQTGGADGSSEVSILSVEPLGSPTGGLH